MLYSINARILDHINKTSCDTSESLKLEGQTFVNTLLDVRIGFWEALYYIKAFKFVNKVTRKNSMLRCSECNLFNKALFHKIRLCDLWIKKTHCTKPTNIHLWRVITYTLYLTVVVTLFTKKSTNKRIKYLNKFHFISQQDSHCCIIISEMSGSNITSANMQTNYDGISNWDLEQWIVYLTVLFSIFGLKIVKLKWIVVFLSASMQY